MFGRGVGSRPHLHVCALLHISTTPAMKLDLAARAARRSVLLSLAATCTLPSLPALAEYGEGAQIAPPALVPSPFRPTGEMAKYCEVVALGREDVCLEPKKLLTAYDSRA